MLWWIIWTHLTYYGLYISVDILAIIFRSQIHNFLSYLLLVAEFEIFRNSKIVIYIRKLDIESLWSFM